MEDFVNRESQFPNRRRLEIVSQTPNEIIADIYREEGNISNTSTLPLPFKLLQISHSLQGLPFFGFKQFIAFANIFAILVLPVPLVPVNK